MSRLRVAAFQRQPRFNDVAGVVERLHSDLAWSDRQGVDLAIFPECYLQGYFLEHASVDAAALGEHGLRSALTRCAEIRSMFVVGWIERQGQSIYNAAAVIRGGAVAGNYRKIHLHRKEQAFDAGSDVPVFEIARWRFGVNICYDSNFSEAAARIAGRDARLICYPINNLMPPDVAERWRSRSLDTLRYRAVETGCWVVSSDVVGRHDAMLSHGCTCIVAPTGDVVARVEEGNEGAVVYDCD